MDSKRLEEICKSTAYPESSSVYQALLQMWVEVSSDFKSQTCENCTHAIKSEKRYATIFFCGGALKFQQVQGDFGCNEWKAIKPN